MTSRLDLRKTYKRKADGMQTCKPSKRRHGVIHGASGQESRIQGKVHAVCNVHVRPDRFGEGEEVTCFKCCRAIVKEKGLE